MDAFVATPDYHIEQAFVMSNEREVKQNGKVTYLPIYYVMFFIPSTPPTEVLL